MVFRVNARRRHTELFIRPPSNSCDMQCFLAQCFCNSDCDMWCFLMQCFCVPIDSKVCANHGMPRLATLHDCDLAYVWHWPLSCSLAFAPSGRFLFEGCGGSLCEAKGCRPVVGCSDAGLHGRRSSGSLFVPEAPLQRGHSGLYFPLIHIEGNECRSAICRKQLFSSVLAAEYAFVFFAVSSSHVVEHDRVSSWLVFEGGLWSFDSVIQL